MQPADISDAQLDDIIRFEFPYPLAVIYDRLLKETDSSKRIALCFNSFQFGIRTITLVLIVRYLLDEAVNDVDLNQDITDYLGQIRPKKMIDILQGLLKAYEGRGRTFFMSELYDLYWQEGQWQPLRQQFDALTDTYNDIFQQNKLTGDLDATASDLHDRLRQVMRTFQFMRNYELWSIIENRQNSTLLHYEWQRGIDKDPHFVHYDQLVYIDPHTIKKGHFYLAKREGDQCKLLEVDPLIMHSLYLKFEDDVDTESLSDLIGVHDSWIPMGERLTYLGFAAQLKSLTPGDTDVVKRFLYLYGKLEQKQKEYNPAIDFSWDNLRLTFARQSRQQQEIIQGKEDDPKQDRKYIATLYIEREALAQQLHEFLNHSNHFAVAVTGNVGVGKTNLLLSTYFSLRADTNTSVLWVTGQNFDAEQTFSKWLVDLLKEHLNLDDFDTSDPEAALREMLRSSELHKRRIVIIMDGINENPDSRVFQSLMKFVSRFAGRTGQAILKLIVSSRPEFWRYAVGQTDNYNKSYFFRGGEDISQQQDVELWYNSFLLKPFSKQEQERAFPKYTRFYGIQNANINRLTDRLQQAMRQPLLMKIVCRIHQGKEAIPRDFDIENLVPEMLEALVEDKRLKENDTALLRDHIVPLFLANPRQPETRLSREILKNTPYMSDRNNIVADNTLDDQITNDETGTDKIPINIRFQRLAEAGILVRSGSITSYHIEFRYEFYYDFFVGEWLLEQSRSVEDKVTFLEEWIDKLSQHAFLWGPLRNLLIFWIRETDITQIERFGYTDNDRQRDLVASVVTYYYDYYPDAVNEVLGKWLKSSYEKAGQISSVLAIDKSIQNLIVDALSHPTESIRLLTIQQIYKLWEPKPGAPDSHKEALDVLNKIASNIHPRNTFRPRLLINSFASLTYASFVIIMRHYNVHMYEGAEKGLHEVQQVWLPVFNRMRVPFLVIPRFMRLRVLRVMMRWVAMPILARMWNEESNSLIDVREGREFYPVRPEIRAIFDRLMPQINAVADKMPIDDIVPYLEELVVTVNDYVTAVGLGLIILVAHVFNDRLATARAVLHLTQVMVEKLPKTTDLNNPTATFWIYPLPWCLGNIKYDDLDPVEAREILTIMVEIIRLIETHFKSAVKASDGRIIRPSLIADPVAWCNQVDLDLGIQLQKELLDICIENNDEQRIRQYAKHLAEAIQYHSLPHAALNGLYDFITYLKKRQYGNEAWWKLFWTDLGDKMVQTAASYHEAVKNFVLQFDEDEIPPSTRRSMLEMPPKEDISGELAVAGLHFGRYALKDENPVMRDFMADVAWNLFEHDNIENWIIEVLLRVGDAVYGDNDPFIPV